MHYIGAELCAEVMRAGASHKFLSVVKYGVTTNSWWDTVDIFAASAMSDYLRASGKGDEILRVMDKWAVSDNLWMRRTALLCQLKLKDQADLARLKRYILLNKMLA